MLENVIIVVFHRAGIFAFVVAQPIQDLSAVSITDKTVGIHLPRLWCGAVGLVCFGTANHPKRVSSSFSPLYMVGWGDEAERSFRVCEENDAKAEPVKYSFMQKFATILGRNRFSAGQSCGALRSAVIPCLSPTIISLPGSVS
jgi:hypothetical protein